MQESYMNCAFINTAPIKSSGKNIAIIGAGPAGLASAGYLASAGHAVTVFDKLAVAGGLMTHGIPEWRIPKENIQGGVEHLQNNFAVTFQYNTKVIGNIPKDDVGDLLVKHTIALDDLRKEFSAVLLTTGSWAERSLGIENEDAQGVYGGLDFLYRIRAKQYGSAIETIDVTGKRVIVVGAGFTAIDVAIRAMEHGASSVSLIYRKTRTEAPAGFYEISHAIDAGVAWIEKHSPVSVMGASSIEGVRFLDISSEQEVVFPCDILIKAIGDSSCLPSDSICERIMKEKSTNIMQEERTFIAGDVYMGASKIGKAVYSGLRTARSIITLFEKDMSSQFFRKNAIALHE